MLNILFIGTSEISTIVLDYLSKDSDINIKGIISQPDREIINRKEKSIKKPFMKLFLENSQTLNNIPLYQPEKLNNDKDLIESIKLMELDFIVVVSYGQIISKEILDIAPSINVHPSFLPKYRGATPIETTLLNNDKEIGISIILMDEKMDAGDILSRDYFIRNENDSYEYILEKIYNESKKELLRVLKDYKNIIPFKQEVENISFCKKITKENYIIDVNNSYIDIYNQNFVFGKDGLKLGNLKLYNINVINKITNKESGTFEFDKSKNLLIINLKNCILEVSNVQRIGKNIQNVKDFNNGIKVDNLLLI